MKSWVRYLKNGLARARSQDRFAASAQSTKQTMGELCRRFLPFLVKFRKPFLFGMGLVFLAAAVSLPLPLVGRFLIDDVIMNRRLPLLAWTILAMIGLAVVGRLLDLYQQYYFERFNREVVLDIQSGLLEKVFHYAKTFFDRARTGYLMNRLEEDVHGVGWFFSGAMAGVIENIFRFLGGLIFLLYLDWRLTIIVGVMLPGAVIMVRYFSDRLRTLGNENMEMQADVAANFQESLSAIALIKAFAAEGKTLQQLRGALRKALDIAVEQSTVNALANMAITSMPGIARAAALFIGAYWVIIGHWSLGSLFAYQAYLAYVFGPAESLATANLDMHGALASANRIANLFDLVPEENTGQGKIVTRLAGNIEFKQVCFAYEADASILSDISFSIRAGERIAVAGASGVGKTTLISLILRLYRPTGGEIFFDSRPASDYEVGSLRERIGYVPQQNWLLAGTIMDNITYGNPEAGESDAIAAAKNAGIHEFIATLAEGYQTAVGERGVALSEGQRQRICVARAFLKDPDIILMDEPASALDGRTGKAVLSSLLSVPAGKTVIVVSNQAGFLAMADRVLVLQGNRLATIGAHEELMSSNPDYAAIVIGAAGTVKGL
jgi:ABC-type bacteriocin/lantibiotic exporter with double-glycine peptidase domain